MPQLSKQDIKENFKEFSAKLDRLFISLLERQRQELLMLGSQLRKLEERVTKLESK